MHLGHLRTIQGVQGVITKFAKMEVLLQSLCSRGLAIGCSRLDRLTSIVLLTKLRVVYIPKCGAGQTNKLS